AADAFEAVGALLLGAEAAAAAARAHARDGLTRRASESRARAARLADACEGARTPALADDAELTPLTRREREVAELAARGLTNREVAEKLFVSTRTVENHLQRAYEKIGVRSRGELAEALGITGDAAPYPLRRGDRRSDARRADRHRSPLRRARRHPRGVGARARRRVPRRDRGDDASARSLRRHDPRGVRRARPRPPHVL